MNKRLARSTVGAATLALVAGLAGLAAQPAQAAAWKPTEHVTPATADTPYYARIAVAPNGDATVAWEYYDNSAKRIRVAHRVVGQAWSPAITISPAGPYATLGDVMVNPAGQVVVGYSATVNEINEVHATRISFGDDNTEWHDRKLSATTGAVSYLQFALDDAGTVFSAWRDGASGALRRATFPDGGLVKGNVVTNVSPVGLDLAVTPGGNATLVWVEPSGEQAKIQSTRWTVNSFSGVTTIDTDTATGSVAVAVNKSGAAVAAYRIDAGPQGFFIMGSRRNANTWDNPSPLSTNGENAVAPAVGIDGSGRAVVAWTTGSHLIRTATRAPGADWAEAVTLADAGTTSGPVVRMNDRGDAAVQYPVAGPALGLSVRPAGAAAFATLPPLASSSLLIDNRGLALDAQGNVAITTAVELPDAKARVLARVYDMAGPTAKVTKPGSNRVNATKFPVAWKVTDRYSAIAGTDVQVKSAPFNGGFGPLALVKNDTVATGTTFAGKPGRTYCFRAIGTDAAGNAGTASPFRCTATPVDDRKPAATGFAKKTGPAYYQGTYRQASAKGSTLTLTGVQVRTLSLLVAKGPGHGTIAVYFNGVKLGSFSLGAASSKVKQQLLIKKFASVKTGTLKIKVISAGKPVRIDGIHVVR